MDKRYNQGWITHKITDLDELIATIKKAREGMSVSMEAHPVEQVSISIGYLGNIVDVWERLANEEELLVDLGSDQTSLHNPYMGGYYPVGMTLEESKKMMRENPEEFKNRVYAASSMLYPLVTPPWEDRSMPSTSSPPEAWCSGITVTPSSLRYVPLQPFHS